MTVHAVVLVQCEVDAIPEAAQAIAELDGVSEVYSVAGEFDLVAIVRVAEHDELATVIPGFPAWELAGLIGSLCWLAWMIALGAFLLRAAPEPHPVRSCCKLLPRPRSPPPRRRSCSPSSTRISTCGT